MTETAGRPLIRPVFFKLSLVVLALLVPMVVHAGWDYVETRRVRELVAEIQGKGEAVTVGAARRRPVTDAGLRSDRYYRAAAVLASPNVSQEQGLFERARQAERSGEWSAGLAEELRRRIDDRQDALQMLDRAAPLVFEGLSPGAEGESSALFPLARLAGLRTMSLVLDGDGERAAASLHTELRLRPVLEWAWPIFRAQAYEVERVGSVMSSTHPPSRALSSLEAALADLDRDNGLKEWFLRRRAALFESTVGPVPVSWTGLERDVFDRAGFGGTALGRFLGRPWFEREMRKRADALSAIIAALDQPWPLRAGAVDAVYDASSRSAGDRFSLPDVGMSKQIVSDLALVRAARVVVAIERYRREHAERMPPRLDDLVPGYLAALPVDPYSGWPLILRAEVRSYAVYSLGANRRDDNGDFTLLRFAQAARESRDVGMRIQYR